MTRNLKTLSLAITAVLALSAVAASAASGVEDKFRTSAGQTAHLTAEAGGLPEIKWSTNDSTRYIKCSKTSLTGTMTDGANELTLTPTSSGCLVMTQEGGGGTSGEVFGVIEFNECDYRFRNVTTSGNPTGGEHANFAIICPKGNEIKVTLTALKLKCVSTPEQEVTHGARYDVEETEGKISDVNITLTAHSIKNTTPNTVACPTGTGEPVVHTDGIYIGNFKVAGFKDAGHKEPTSISVE
jgi:hypothetical protein